MHGGLDSCLVMLMTFWQEGGNREEWEGGAEDGWKEQEPWGASEGERR